ncbi:hypothetical protein HOY25_000109 [Shigella boydii]|nr:hypothetical protein [Shigella boydii]EIQ27763.1 phosphate acetyl/butaryl transferase family protein [Shigella boydii 965-58]EFX6397739.1 hypothetical protein [Shigella boydii]EFY9968438.1 hypothetical protein [Shigella boydii]EFY9988706.1 hypothetical protein [Shigella boydii]
MIIERCRELALRAPARVVFPDALDQRVLKAAQYLHQQGLATPILVANPFELRQFALSHGVAMDGLQVIDPHGNLAMREEFAHRWLARAGEKTPPDALEKLTDPLMFAAAMVSAGKADVCIVGNLSSTANVLRAGLRIIGLQPGCKTLSSIFLMLPQYSGPALGFADCSVVPQPTAAQLADIALASAETWRAITGEEPRVAMLSFSSNGSARHPCVANVQHAVKLTAEQAQQLQPVLLKNIDERGKGTVSRDWVGRDAAKIAAAIGLNVPQETRLLFVETTAEHPFAVTELMMPVLPVVRVANVADAIALAVKLEGGCHHTAAMHSRNIENMNQMANAIDTSIFVKNGPCIAGLGLGGEGWTTMTITTPTGEGVTSARTFVRLRRCVLVDAFRIV